MAQINLMSWNIQTFGQKKANSPNNIQLASFIAASANRNNPQVNLIVLLELFRSTADDVCRLVQKQLNSWYRPSTWQYVWVAARPTLNEAYAFFWLEGQGFDVAPNNQVVAFGTADFDQNLQPLDFPSKVSIAGHGRRPGYVFFRTNGNSDFVVVAYHPSPIPQYLTRAGVERLAEMRQMYNVSLPNNPQTGDPVNGVQVAARFVCGDFNLDFAQDRNSYDIGIINPLKTKFAANESTLLRTLQNPPANANNPNLPTANYRQPNKAIDNIFYGPWVQNQVGQGPVGTVRDTVADCRADGALAPVALGFRGTGFPNANLVHQPVNSPSAWILAYYAISDHLPVITSANVP